MQPPSNSTAARIVTALGWATATAGLGVVVTQATGWNRIRLVSVVQSLTPALALACLPAAAIGAVRRDPLLTLAGVASAVGLVAVVAPAVRRPVPATTDLDPVISVVHSNLLYTNVERAAETVAAVLAIDADVLALSEVTVHHLQALADHGAEAIYPYRTGRPAKRSEGIVLWSRFPLTDVTVRPLDSRPGIIATVHAPAGPIRIVCAHPDPPTLGRGLGRWKSSLDLIGAVGASSGPPTIIVADLNAARWHPVLRGLLNRGWRDAHEMAGRGLAPSWPTGSRLMPPFIRLDHALLGSGLALVGIRDVDAPGSDHRAFVVTVGFADRVRRETGAGTTQPR